MAAQTLTSQLQNQFKDQITNAYGKLQNDPSLAEGVVITKELEKNGMHYADEISIIMLNDVERIKKLTDPATTFKPDPNSEALPLFNTALRNTEAYYSQEAARELASRLEQSFKDTLAQMQSMHTEEAEQLQKTIDAEWDKLDDAAKAKLNKQDFSVSITNKVEARQDDDLKKLQQRYKELQKDLDYRIQHGAEHYSVFRKTSPSRTDAELEQLFFTTADDGFKNPNWALTETKMQPDMHFHRTVVPVSKEEYEQLKNTNQLASLRSIPIPPAEYERIRAALEEQRLSMDTAFTSTITMKSDSKNSGQYTGGSVKYDIPLGLVPVGVRIEDQKVIYTEMVRKGADSIDLTLMGFQFDQNSFYAIHEVAKAIWAENPTVTIHAVGLNTEQQQILKTLSEYSKVSKEEFSQARRGELNLVAKKKAVNFTTECTRNGFSPVTSNYGCFNKEFTLPPAKTPKQVLRESVSFMPRPDGMAKASVSSSDANEKLTGDIADATRPASSIKNR